MQAGRTNGVDEPAPPVRPGRGTGPRRRFLWASGAGAAVAVVLFVVVLQSGRSGFFAHDLLGNFYDGQGHALLRGHLDVDPAIPGFEGFRIGERTYIYQGLTPTLARLPVLVVTDRLDGRLTGLSMLVAYVVALGYVVMASWRVRVQLRGRAAMGRLEAACTAVATFGIGASSLLFLASKSWVYHEALLWGAALCLGSLVHLAYWLTPRTDTAASPRVRHLVAAVVLAGLAVNTRSSVGLGALAALGLTVVCLLLQGVVGPRWPGTLTVAVRRITGWVPSVSTRRPVATACGVVLGVLAAMVLYTGVNYGRFGSLSAVPLDKQVLVANDPARQEALDANDGSLFGLQYAPSVLWAALRPDAISVQGQFPFLAFPESRPTVLGDAVFAEQDWSSSVPASEPLLFVGAILGAAVLVAPRRLLGRRTPDGSTPPVAALRIPVIGAAVGGAAIVVFGYIAQRYLSDLYPLLVLGALVGLHTVAARLDPRGDGSSADGPARPRVAIGVVAATVAVLSVWSAWANTSLALQYQLEISPGANATRRAAWLRTQSSLGASIDPVRIQVDQDLPPAGPVGQVLVVGDCDWLYRSNGSGWNLLESSSDAVGSRLQLDLSGSVDEPVVLASAQDGTSTVDLVLEPAGGGRVRLVLETAGDGPPSRSDVGPAFSLGSGATTLDLLMDWRTSDVSVLREDPATDVLRIGAELPEAPFVAVGDASLRVTTAPATTPVCDSLLS